MRSPLFVDEMEKKLLRRSERPSHARSAMQLCTVQVVGKIHKRIQKKEIDVFIDAAAFYTLIVGQLLRVGAENTVRRAVRVITDTSAKWFDDNVSFHGLHENTFRFFLADDNGLAQISLRRAPELTPIRRSLMRIK